MKFSFTGIDKNTEMGIEAFSHDYGFTTGEGGIPVTVKKCAGNGFTLKKENGAVEISLSRPVQLFRALSMLIARDGEESLEISEQMQFDTLCAMIDGCQASSALNLETCKKMLRMLAAMGYNMFMIYCEDCLELPDEPLFGYMRPRYSKRDFTELDDYAASLGIEMVPCIETLGHLTDAIRWSRYSSFSDNQNVLLAGDARTAALVEKMIKTVSECFRTKRIHVGLDEAWHLGQGNYLMKNGYHKKIDIMTEHVRLVSDICARLGLKPMMWGDMYFRALTPDGGYYNTSVEFPEDIKSRLPENMQIIYWDYYNSYPTYVNMIDSHRKLSEDVIFAGCSRNTRTFASHHTKTVQITNDSMRACKEKGVREVIVTVWGDDHRESSLLSVLPGLQLYAEHAYHDKPQSDEVERRFVECTGMGYKAVEHIKYFDQIEQLTGDNMRCVSPSKLFMWQDILMGLFDENLKDSPYLGDYYAQLRGEMQEYAVHYPEYADFFNFYAALADALEIKADIGRKILDAYRSNNKTALEAIAHETLPELERRVENLRLAHLAHNMHLYKPVGWEILDIRYGGVICRARTAALRIRQYLDGAIQSIAELDEPRQPYNGNTALPASMDYNRICSASRI